jgi:AcrR family transcriptional regulator
LASYSSGEQTRRALINAAGELAAEIGFANVTTRAIASAAGENVGSIHYHFGGKEQLFHAVLMEATRDMMEKPFSKVLDELEPVLDTPEGQSRGIRALVRAKADSLFRDDQPEWHCRVIYQVMRKASPLRDYLTEKIIGPSIEADHRLFRHIDPEMSKEERTIHALLLSTPLYFLADYMEAILMVLGEAHYTESYLEKLEDRIVRQTQRYFGLPDDRKAERGDSA